MLRRAVTRAAATRATQQQQKQQLVTRGGQRFFAHAHEKESAWFRIREEEGDDDAQT